MSAAMVATLFAVLVTAKFPPPMPPRRVSSRPPAAPPPLAALETTLPPIVTALLELSVRMPPLPGLMSWFSVIAPPADRVTLLFVACVVISPLVDSVPVVSMAMLPTLSLVPRPTPLTVRLPVLANWTLPPPDSKAEKLLTVLLAIVLSVVPPLDCVVSVLATRPPPAPCVIAPPMAFSGSLPSAMSVIEEVAPPAACSVLSMLMPPSRLRSTMPPVALLGLTVSPDTVIEPVWALSPMVSCPPVKTRSSVASERFRSAVFVPRLMARAASFEVSVTEPAPVVMFWVKAISSAISVSAEPLVVMPFVPPTSPTVSVVAEVLRKVTEPLVLTARFATSLFWFRLKLLVLATLPSRRTPPVAEVEIAEPGPWVAPFCVTSSVSTPLPTAMSRLMVTASPVVSVALVLLVVMPLTVTPAIGLLPPSTPTRPTVRVSSSRYCRTPVPVPPRLRSAAKVWAALAAWVSVTLPMDSTPRLVTVRAWVWLMPPLPARRISVLQLLPLVIAAPPPTARLPVPSVRPTRSAPVVTRLSSAWVKSNSPAPPMLTLVLRLGCSVTTPVPLPVVIASLMTRSPAVSVTRPVAGGAGMAVMPETASTVPTVSVLAPLLKMKLEMPPAPAAVSLLVAASVPTLLLPERSTASSVEPDAAMTRSSVAVMPPVVCVIASAEFSTTLLALTLPARLMPASAFSASVVFSVAVPAPADIEPVAATFRSPSAVTLTAPPPLFSAPLRLTLLKAEMLMAPPVVLTAPMLNAPLLSFSEGLLLLPAAIVTVLAPVIAEPPAMKNWAAPGSRLADRKPGASVVLTLVVAEKSPPFMVMVIAPLLLAGVVVLAVLARMMWRPACSVRSWPAVPAPPATLTSVSTVMSLLACRIRLAPFIAATTLAALSSEVPAALSANASLVATASAPAAVMRMFFGSSSSVPVSPCGARRSTVPLNTSDSLPETSTKPPLPPCAPPRAEIVP